MWDPTSTMPYEYARATPSTMPDWPPGPHDISFAIPVDPHAATEARKERQLAHRRALRISQLPQYRSDRNIRNKAVKKARKLQRKKRKS